jgi:SpoVK/Ycf46/Vps4 family AAA+-type ATPase
MLKTVLVIDEAHTFLPVGANNANAHDREALETLDALMEKHAGELSVVLTGSRKEIEQLLRQQPGLKARFSTVLSLPDYSSGQLLEILEKLIAARGFLCSDEGKKAAAAAIRARNRAGDAVHTNAHLCRGILEDAILRQSVRIVDQDVTGPGLITLEAGDFEEENRKTGGFDLEERFSTIIGLESIKDFLRGLHAQLRLEAARKAAGLDTGRGQSLHMVFRGNPGTGKTMMARILAELFQSMGVLRTGNLVETDRGGLVAGYVGQTAEKRWTGCCLSTKRTRS